MSIWISESNVWPPPRIISAGIWSLPGDLYILNFAIAISTLKGYYYYCCWWWWCIICHNQPSCNELYSSVSQFLLAFASYLWAQVQLKETWYSIGLRGGGNSWHSKLSHSQTRNVVILSSLYACRTPSNVMLCHWHREALMLPVVPLIENEDLQPHSIVGDKVFPLNPLKHSGYYMYHLLSHSEALHLPTKCLCVSYESQKSSSCIPRLH
jgi:hypothetical protein